VNTLLIGLLSALVATNPPAALSNLAVKATGASADIPNPNDPAEMAFQKLMADDNAAQAEVDTWIRADQEFAAKGAGAPADELNRRIRARFEPVRKAYDDFIARHPDHVPARLTYASFLDDLHEEKGELAQLNKARELDPKSPAVWNQLANYCGEHGPVTNAFAYYAKAIELNPSEALYCHNAANVLCLYGNAAMEFYGLSEQQVFAKALDLYGKALKLDPDNFPLASDAAQTYYGIKPLRADDALQAWTNALALAHDEIEREGVYLHFARINLAAERFDEARRHLSAVTNEVYAKLKKLLTKNLDEQERQAKGTNSPLAPEKK
jgi:tetratricopeptide (TPR) repeat protein